MRKYIKIRVSIFSLIFLAVFLLFSSASQATSGCCSWHGGVSHCDTSVGRQVCNDGTYSPSCGCTYIPPTPKPTPLVPFIKPVAVGTTKITGQIKYCGFGEMFSTLDDANKSKDNAIASAKQTLLNENATLKKDNQNLNIKVDNLNNDSGDSFWWGLLIGILGTGGIVWYNNKKIKQ